MRKISFGPKTEALDLYLQGFSANEVVAKTGISKGAVISILKDAREGKFPGLELRERIDELHRLSVRLRKEGLELGKAKLGFSFFKRLLDMGVEPDRVKEWIDFCSELSPSALDSLVPAAMGLFRVEKETGKSYAEIASEVKELSTKREILTEEVGDLEAKEARTKELEEQMENSQKQVAELRAENGELERMATFLDGFLKEKAEKFGLSPSELEEKIKEFVSLEDEIVSRRKEKGKLEGELEVLTERHEKFSARLNKASADFEKDLKLIKQVKDELTTLAEIKGRYEEEVEEIKWARKVIPFLYDPHGVADRDYNLVSIVVNCLDKWIESRWGPLERLNLRWNEVKSYVNSKRKELRGFAQ
jgi:predicted  nucleic acid-binding Zn-ribbon protein